MGIATSTSASNLQRALLTLESYQGMTLQFGAYKRTFTYDDRLPSTIDILKALQDFEACEAVSYEMLNDDEFELQEKGYTFQDAGNTYNWGAQISHDINWRTYYKDGKIYSIISIHYGMDIRSGYTNDFVCEFTTSFELFEIIDGFETSYIESANGRNYFVTVRPLTDTITVDDVETGATFEMFSVDDLEETTKKKEETK